MKYFLAALATLMLVSAAPLAAEPNANTVMCTCCNTREAQQGSAHCAPCSSRCAQCQQCLACHPHAHCRCCAAETPSGQTACSQCVYACPDCTDKCIKHCPCHWRRCRCCHAYVSDNRHCEQCSFCHKYNRCHTHQSCACDNEPGGGSDGSYTPPWPPNLDGLHAAGLHAGLFVCYNNDDDSENGTVDYLDANCADDDDLVPAHLALSLPEFPGHALSYNDISVSVTYPSQYLRVWDEHGATVLPGTFQFSSASKHVLIEGVDPTAANGVPITISYSYTVGFCCGEYHTFVPVAGSMTTNLVLYTCDLDVDTDNDGVIDSANDGEDAYEAHPPGKIICVNLEGDGPGLDETAELRLTLRPYNLGTVTLSAPQGADNIRICTSAGGSGALQLPQVYPPGSLPSSGTLTLYVDGVTQGSAVIEMALSNAAGTLAVSDRAAVHVREPVSYAPRSINAYIWAPIPEMGRDNVAAFRSLMKDQGFKTLVFTDWSGYNNTDFGNCTLQNYLNLRDSGALLITASHGHKGIHGPVYASLDASGSNACVAWTCAEPHMIVAKAHIYETNVFGYAVGVFSAWHADNWSHKLNDNKAIVYHAYCHTAVGRPDRLSMMSASGGRWSMGHSTTSNERVTLPVITNFFSAMSGIDNANRRTTGEAYNNGVGFDRRVVMTGNVWTTLCPAPVKHDAAWPTSNPGNRTGVGFLLFDSYMQTRPGPIYRSMGNRAILRQWWGHNSHGAHAAGFKYGKSTQSAIFTARATHCRNTAADEGRELDGNRKAPNKDNKSIPF